MAQEKRALTETQESWRPFNQRPGSRVTAVVSKTRPRSNAKTDWNKKLSHVAAETDKIPQDAQGPD